MEKSAEIDNFEMRVQAVESRIYGERKNRGGKPVKCAESLARIQAALANTANKRERVKILHKKRKVTGCLGIGPAAAVVSDKNGQMSWFVQNLLDSLLVGAVEDLVKYLDPQFTDHITVPDAMKLEFILAEEEFLLSQAALLEQVSKLQPLLDSNYIRDVPEHATKLQRLSQIHIKEQDQAEVQTQEVKRLFEEYNKMMVLLSKQFTQWDETLRKLEEAKGTRPVEQ